MSPRRLTAMAAVVVLSTPLAGQERRDTIRTDSGTVLLPNVVVQGTRPDATLGGASTVRARLSALSLPTGATFEDVLRALPALHVRRNSRGEAEVSVRGSESRQVAVLVDGVPLHLAWDSRADLSVIPATAPNDITLTRGLSSMLYGPNVLGGVVELSVGHMFQQPLRASGVIAAEVDHVGGYAGTATLTVPHGTPSGHWLIRAGGGRRDSPGFPLPRGVSEPVAAPDDLRVNTDARAFDGFLAVRYAHYNGAWFSVSGSAFQAERGIAAELGTNDARFWRYPHIARGVVAVSGGTGHHDTGMGRGDVEASIGVDVGRTEIVSYDSRDYDAQQGFENGNDRTLTLRLLADHTLGVHGELRTAFTLADIRHDEFLPEGDARYRQRLWSAGVETVWRLIERARGINWLRLSVGGAWDVGQTPESGGREPLGTLHDWGARAGATMGVREGRTLIHAAVSRRARFPALRELYSGALDRFAPNPDLRPERLVAIEAGVTTRVGPGEVQLVGFRHDLRDAVARTTLPDRRFFRVNLNQLESFGLEMVATVSVGWVTLGADATVQSVESSDPAGVSNQPENLPGLFGRLHASARLPLDLRAFGEVRYTGTQSCIDLATGNDTQLDDGAIVSAEVSRVWRVSDGLFGRIETGVAVDNVAGTPLYDQCGLPEPGRLVRVQARVY